ncbi:pyridoxal-dependent decarboxylase [Nocardia sp. NPDC127579]|uniref:pyridoxal-dependent decarboxylase n=1 Tax=Nocardia sp. NPDC127579 TaxID=3345402 RepID=UPI00363A70FA
MSFAGADRSAVFARWWGRDRLAALLNTGLAELAPVLDGHGPGRVPGPLGAVARSDLLRRFARLPQEPDPDPDRLLRELTSGLFAGAVNWRSPHAQHNVGSAVSVVPAAVSALSAAVNINLINDDQGGNAVITEPAVGRILAELARVDAERLRVVFTFGGTGTVLYGMKAGLRKAAPESARTGTPADAVVVVVANAHFSVARAADWLGIGADRVRVVPDGPGCVAATETALRAVLDDGGRIAAIVVNGGTTLDHAVDDIEGCAALRDRLVTEYALGYRPHLHVDAVIGWVWLFVGTPGGAARAAAADPAITARLTEQYRRIAAVRHADSWGVDFHKGPGCVSLDSSCVVFNDAADLERLGGDLEVSVVGPERDRVTNLGYTLETAREAGKAIAALAALHTLGSAGFVDVLTVLVAAAARLRQSFGASSDWLVLNPDALGYQTSLRPLPPGTPRELNPLQDTDSERVRRGNDYVTAFFDWDNQTRMQAGLPGVVYSYCANYRTGACGAPVSALKFYPVSPLISAAEVTGAAELLVKRKAEFDALR